MFIVFKIYIITHGLHSIYFRRTKEFCSSYYIDLGQRKVASQKELYIQDPNGPYGHHHKSHPSHLFSSIKSIISVYWVQITHIGLCYILHSVITGDLMSHIFESTHLTFILKNKSGNHSKIHTLCPP